MQVLRAFLLPLVFLVGVVLFAYTLAGFLSNDAPCAVGACTLTLHEGDSEEVFKYTSGTEFSVRLDERKNSHKDLRCSPRGVIEEIAFTPEASHYVAVFRAVVPGACLLESNTFSAMIVIQ